MIDQIPKEPGIIHFLIESKPDRDGRQRFTLRWKDPNHHDPKYPDRAQCYNAVVEEHIKLAKEKGRKIFVFEGGKVTER